MSWNPFGQKEETSGPKMPSIADIMMLLTKYMGKFNSAKDDKQKMQATIGDLINDVATQERITWVTSAMINGLAKLQENTGQQYVVILGATDNGKDILVKIMRRGFATAEPVYQIYLSHLTQNDFHQLINLMFNNGSNTSTDESGTGKQLADAEQHLIG